MEKSDEAFEYLIDYFKNKEEPVIICMFGDHWPTIEDELLARMEKNSGEDELGILTKEYQTPFLIWANYDIEEKTYENISANYLSTLLLETAGMPLTDYQCYLKNLLKQYPVISVHAVKDKSGNWYTLEEAKEFEAIKEYEKVQYYELFDK